MISCLDAQSKRRGSKDKGTKRSNDSKSIAFDRLLVFEDDTSTRFSRPEFTIPKSELGIGFGLQFRKGKAYHEMQVPTIRHVSYERSLNLSGTLMET